MADPVLPSNYTLCPNTLLILPELVDGELTGRGRIKETSLEIHGSFSFLPSRVAPILPNDIWVIFKKEGAQEVEKNGTSYVLVSATDVLCLLPNT